MFGVRQERMRVTSELAAVSVGDAYGEHEAWERNQHARRGSGGRDGRGKDHVRRRAARGCAPMSGRRGDDDGGPELRGPANGVLPVVDISGVHN